MASQNGHGAVVELLLARGADVDKATEFGATPLFIASQNGHAAVAELLLARGANFNSTLSGGGLTPLQIARERGREDVARLIYGHIRAYMLDCFRATLPPELTELVTAFAFAGH
jgi:ankyrin repeat protein